MFLNKLFIGTFLSLTNHYLITFNDHENKFSDIIQQKNNYYDRHIYGCHVTSIL